MSEPTKQQKAAIVAKGGILLSAGAGTGKTATLVNRCVRLVTEQNVGVDELLVVTFTNAAAAEMKQRLREALQKKSEDQPGDERLRQQLLLLEGANISTIHSFCLNLIRSHYAELGLDPAVAVLDDAVAAPLANETANQVVTDAIVAPIVGQLVENYFGGNGARLAAQIIKIHSFFVKQAGAAELLEHHLSRFARVEPIEWRKHRQDIFKNWLLGWQAPIRHQIPITLEALKDVRGYGRQSATAEGIRGIEKKLPEFGKKMAALSADSSWAEVSGFFEAIRQVEDIWVTGTKNKQGVMADFFIEAAELALWLPNESTDPIDEEWRLVREPMGGLLDLVRKFGERFTAAKRTLGGVDFADLEQLALAVLANAPVADQWRERFKHVFVDECQDINAAQNAIIQKSSHHDERANLFMVGDVKQSIYRFRMAEPKLFRDYAAVWAENRKAHHQVLPLNENFRSREGIVGFVNQLFGYLMGTGFGGVNFDELQFGLKAEDIRSHLSLNPPTNNRPAGHWADPVCRVELHLVDAKAEAEDAGNGESDSGSENDGGGWADLLDMDKQAKVTAQRLKELMDGGHQVWDKDKKLFRKMKWSDVGILLRSPAGRVGAFRSEFLRRDIPLVTEQGDFLSTLEAQDLTALLRVLDNPQQDIPLFAVLRSPLVGFSLDELVAWRPKDKKTVWEQIEKAGEDQRVVEFVEKITRWRRLALMTSLTGVLETVLAETRYEAYLLTLRDGVDRVANVRRFLDLARRYDPQQHQGLRRFLKFIAAQQEQDQEISPLPPRQPEAVQLMSIHKSKGLEFPVVVIASIGSRFNLMDLNEGIILSRSWGIAPQVVDPQSQTRRESLIRWQVRREERQEVSAEELRLLYVAVTRARDTLLLVGSENLRSEGWRKKISLPPEIGVAEGMKYSEWIGQWLGGPADWDGDKNNPGPLTIRNGSQHLAYQIHSGLLDDGELSTKTTGAAPVNQTQITEEQIKKFDWAYPYKPATCAAAKTSASALRRLTAAADNDAVPYQSIRNNSPWNKPNPDKLNAAAAGTAAHAFLQHLDLTKACSTEGLESERDRLIQNGILTGEEGNAVDLTAIHLFWDSQLGKQILAVDPSSIRRELPFTAAFKPHELQMTHKTSASGEDEFVVVQGFVDLAVILPDQIWLVDFKTDSIDRDQLKERADEHAPQLRLYAKALERVYGLTVRQAALHFLNLGATMKIEKELNEGAR
jgi:ATP-dependent helicase/nuclease subunit A